MIIEFLRTRMTARDWAVAALSLAAFGLAVFLFFHERRRATYDLTLTAGSPLEMRYRLAEVLAQEARLHGIKITLTNTSGSEESYQRVNAGVIDLALAQGGLSHEGQEQVRQVTALNLEPMHLLVKKEIYSEVLKSLENLRGKVVNVNREGSGTHWLALDVLRFAGLVPKDKSGRGDFIESRMTQAELEQEADYKKLPDAAFLVTTMPSRVARYMVTRHGYRLVPLGFAEAFALDALNPEGHAQSAGSAPDPGINKMHIYDTVIPAFTYEVEPGVPPERIHTLGTRLMLVANRNVDPEAIAKLLEIIFSTRFAHVAKPPLDAGLLDLPPEMPVHDGTVQYLQRTKPLIAGDMMDLLDKLVTIGAPALGGILFLWQWFRQRYRRMRDEGFEHYIFKVTEIERRALKLEMDAMLEVRELFRLQQDLGHLKSEALAKFVSGELEGEELMSGFLAHVNDARDYLARLLLHARDQLEEQAQLQGKPLRALWNDSLRGMRDASQSGETPGDHQNFQEPVERT